MGPPGSARRAVAITFAVVLGVACGAVGCGPGTSGEKPGTLRILAGSELSGIEPVLAQARRDVGVTATLDYTGTLQAVQAVADGSAAERHEAIWFPSNGPLALQARARAALGPAVKVMSSPIVLGVRADAARRLGWDRAAPTWAGVATAVADKRFTFGMANPAASGSAFLALGGAAVALSGTARGAPLDTRGVERATPGLRRLFTGQAVTAGTEQSLADAYRRDPGQVDGLIGEEAALSRLNASHRPPEPLILVRPRDGAVTADFPLTLLSPASGRVRADFRTLTDYLRRPAVQRRITELTHGPDAPAGSRPVSPEPPAPWRPEVIGALIGDYFDEFRRPGRTVYLLDVSGSMRGMRMWSLKTALTALTGSDTTVPARYLRFHDREQVTLVPFSDRPRRAAAYVVPAARPKAVLTRIRTQVGSLTPDGGTAIYDSLTAAFDIVARQAAHDPGRITSIVVMSDGESDRGQSLTSFGAWYGRRPAALRRIPVFPVLFGESTAERMDQMNRLAALTGGRTFDARLRSLPSVFADIRAYQ
jgi:Ca-activated chloride channel homolog